MKKVMNKLNEGLRSVDECDLNKSITSARCVELDKQLADKIKELEKRTSELKELQEFMKTDKQLYLFEDSRNFCYIDKSGNLYEYKKAHGKHILIGKDFNVYEIVEYEDVRDITLQDDYNRPQIYKIVKVIPLGNSH